MCIISCIYGSVLNDLFAIWRPIAYDIYNGMLILFIFMLLSLCCCCLFFFLNFISSFDHSLLSCIAHQYWKRSNTQTHVFSQIWIQFLFLFTVTDYITDQCAPVLCTDTDNMEHWILLIFTFHLSHFVCHPI